MLRQLAREGRRSFVFIKNTANLSIISERAHARAHPRAHPAGVTGTIFHALPRDNAISDT